MLIINVIAMSRASLKVIMVLVIIIIPVIASQYRANTITCQHVPVVVYRKQSELISANIMEDSMRFKNEIYIKCFSL